MTGAELGTETTVGWKVTLDQEICQGYACCVMAVPAVFDLDDTGKAVVVDDDPDDSLRAAVDDAVRGCPVRAIRVQAR